MKEENLKQRECVVCGKNISDQKGNLVFCRDNKYNILTPCQRTFIKTLNELKLTAKQKVNIQKVLVLVRKVLGTIAVSEKDEIVTIKTIEKVLNKINE